MSEVTYNVPIDGLKCWECGKRNSQIEYPCMIYNEGLRSIICFCEECVKHIIPHVNEMKRNSWYNLEFHEINPYPSDIE